MVGMSFAKAWYRAFPGKVVSLSPTKKRGLPGTGGAKKCAKAHIKQHNGKNSGRYPHAAALL